VKQRLEQDVSDFIAFRKSQGRAVGTIRNDRACMERLLTVCGNVYTANLTDRHVTFYLEHAGKTRAGSLSIDYAVLTSFFAWARKTRRMPRDSDPLLGRKSPKIMPREKRKLAVGDFPALLDAATLDRDRIVVALGLFLLLRVSEIRDLKIRDVDLDEGEISVRVFKSKMIDRMPISSELDTELRRWLRAYVAECGSLQQDWYLVPSAVCGRVSGPRAASRGPLKPSVKSSEALTKSVQRTLDRIGFPLRDENGQTAREGVHTLRRSGARAIFESLQSQSYDYAMRTVQSMLHHSNQTTTERYLGLEPDRHRRNAIIRGRSLYPEMTGGNVVPLRAAASDE